MIKRHEMREGCLQALESESESGSESESESEPHAHTLTPTLAKLFLDALDVRSLARIYF